MERYIFRCRLIVELYYRGKRRNTLPFFNTLYIEEKRKILNVDIIIIDKFCKILYNRNDFSVVIPQVIVDSQEKYS